MKNNRLEDLWASADDGASTPVSLMAIPAGAETDDLLNAWFIEREKSLEFEILLDQARGLIQKLLVQRDVSDSGQKRARRLINAINRSLETARIDKR